MPDPTTDTAAEHPPELTASGDTATSGTGSWLSILPTAMLSVTALVFAGLFTVTALLGRYVRPTSDDYCIAWKERDWGVLGIVHEYYFHRTGRIANAFVSGVVYMGGGWITKIFPLVLMSGLALGVGWLAYVFAARMSGPRARSYLAAACAGLGVALATGWGAHSTYQVVYWAPGSISHTLPSVLAILVTVFALAMGGRRWAWLAGLAFVVGFIDATLSEAFVVTSGTVLAAAVLFRVVHGDRTGAAVRIMGAGVAGLIVGAIVLTTSPGAIERRKLLNGVALSTGESFRRAVVVFPRVLSLSYNVRFLLPILALGLLLGLLVPLRGLSRLALKWVVAAGVVLPFLLAFEVTVLLGRGYGRNGWQYARVWGDFTILSGVMILLATYVLVSTLAARVSVSPRVAVAVAAVPLALVMVGVGYHVDAARSLRAKMVHRSVQWDAQAARIRAEAGGGAATVGYHPLHIAGLAEPFHRPWAQDYPGHCVARYFHVRRIVRARAVAK